MTDDVMRFFAAWMLTHEVADEGLKAAVARGADEGPEGMTGGPDAFVDGLAAMVAEEKERLKRDLEARARGEEVAIEQPRDAAQEIAEKLQPYIGRKLRLKILEVNRKKVSTYANMIGKKVAEPFVNIVDEGITPRQLGSVNVDDEGVPGQRTMLVENGILTSYLHDRISAKYYQVKPTGNGRRQSYQYTPIPRMRNTYMLAGDSTPEEIIQSVDKGIYVEDVSNGQVKIGEGDFAFFVSQGKLIENGRITAPIKDVNIMGNGPKMLLNVTMVANDLELYQGGSGACGKDGQSMPVSFGSPTCLVKSMTVGGVNA
mgnify:CR=1 FL=1